MKTVASIFIKCVRETDIVARLGGDEFCILMDGIDEPENAILVANKIVAAFGQPLLIRKYELHVTASIGIAVFPEDGMAVETLIKNADVAMYATKQQGKNQYKLYSSLDPDNSAA